MEDRRVGVVKKFGYYELPQVTVGYRRKER